MKNSVISVRDAAKKYLFYLSDKDKRAIKCTIPSYRSSEAREYIDNIINIYDLSDRNEDLSRDLSENFQNDLMFELVFQNNRELFAGSMIYKQVWESLQESDSTPA